MQKIIVGFQRKNETKGAVRFEEVGGKGDVLDFKDCQIGTLYIRKSALQMPFPDFITVTVETGK